MEKSGIFSTKELEELKQALDQHAIVTITDLSGKILYVNELFCEVSGFSEKELLGSNHRIMKSGMHDLSFVKAMYQTISSGKTWHGEYCNRAKNGSLFWLETTIVPLLDEQQQLHRYLSIRTNITEVKILEKQLRASKERYEISMSITNDGIWDWNIQTGEVFFDSNYYTMAGYQNNEFTAGFDEWEKRVDPEDLPVVTEKLNQYLSGETSNYETEFRFLRKNGTYMWIRGQGRIVRFDSQHKPLRMIGTHSDINEQKNTLLALYKTQRNLVAAQKHAKIGHYTFWIDSGRWESSKELDDIFGIDSSPCKELAVWIALIHPDEREGVAKYLQENVIKNQQTFDRIYRIIDQTTDKEKWVHGLGKLKLDHENNPIEMFGTIQDITHYKQAELALQRAQKMEAIGQLSGGIAHDFNNILGIIIGNLDLLEDQFCNDKSATKRIDSAIKAATRAEKLTKQLLGFSRHKVIESKQTCLNSAITEMKEVLDHAVGTKAQINYCFSPSLWQIKVDRGELEDALLNLLINAKDATQDTDPAIISLASSNTVLDSQYCNSHQGALEGEYVKLSVIDNGEGMDEERASKIFDPFFTTKPVGKGTGLGLSMVFGFVKRSGGYLEVQSTVNNGSKFDIYLPRSATVKPEVVSYMAIRPQYALTDCLGNQSILLVDDEQELVELAAATLEKLGYTIYRAFNAEQAINKMKLHRPIDLLFSDVIMPGGTSGIELAEIAQRDYPLMKVLLSSGYTGKEDQGVDIDLESTKFLRKPYTQQQMAMTIKQLLTC